MINQLLAFLAVLIIIIMIIISCYISKNEFWIGSKGTFRYNSYFKNGYYNNLLNTIKDPPFKITEIYNKSNNDKIFSISIYGKSPKYVDGLRKVIINHLNSPLEWTLRVYCHDQIDPSFKQELINNNKIETYMVNDPLVVPGNSAGMFWRFMPLSEDITFMTLDSDEDNKILKRPDLLQKWLDSDKGFFRYARSLYPWPKTHICGKYFGRKKGYSKVDPSVITHYPIRTPFGADEVFELQVAGPLIQKDGIMSYITPNSIIQKIIFSISKSNSRFGKYNKHVDEIVH